MIEQVIPAIKSLNESEEFKKNLHVFSKFLALSSLLVTPQVFFSLIGFLDDLWYYRFHRTNYPQEAQFFMNKTDVMNEVRFLITKNNTPSN